MKLAPIVVFVYNRLIHTKKTIEALKQNKLAQESVLYIFSDGPKQKDDISTIEQIRSFLKTIDGFKEIYIFEQEKNIGLANSIIEGVSNVINRHGKIIVLEDDIVTSPKFLSYMNFLLDRYIHEKKIYSISGYNHSTKIMGIPSKYPYDVYFNPRPSSQGWGTWLDRWSAVDWDIKDFEKFRKSKKKRGEFNCGGDDMYDMLFRQMRGKIDSWAIRWSYHHFVNKSLCVYPTVSFVNNIGHDNSGTHCGTSEKYHNAILNMLEPHNIRTPINIEINKLILKRFKTIYKKSFLKKIILPFIRESKIRDTYLQLKRRLIN